MSLGIMTENMGWGVLEAQGWRKGPWTSEEDRLLIEYVKLHGEGRWNSVARLQGLKRNGKSCRLRWVNYLRPDLKRGQITPNEESVIIELHARWGNRWSTIARSLPGRTDNEIKNYWRTHFKKKTKVSPSDANKSKARMLKRQQFQQQQQLLLQQQQQHEVDMQRIMSNLRDQSEVPILSLPQHQLLMKQQDHSMASSNNCTQTVNSDQRNYGYSSLAPMVSNFNDSASVAESSSDQDFFWDSNLWNLDDIQGNFSDVPAANRAAAPLQDYNSSPSMLFNCY